MRTPQRGPRDRTRECHLLLPLRSQHRVRLHACGPTEGRSWGSSGPHKKAKCKKAWTLGGENPSLSAVVAAMGRSLKPGTASTCRGEPSPWPGCFWGGRGPWLQPSFDDVCTDVSYLLLSCCAAPGGISRPARLQGNSCLSLQPEGSPEAERMSSLPHAPRVQRLAQGWGISC